MLYNCRDNCDDDIDESIDTEIVDAERSSRYKGGDDIPHDLRNGFVTANMR